MKSKKSFFRTVEPYLYLVPVMILFILFVFWPFVKTIQRERFKFCVNRKN